MMKVAVQVHGGFADGGGCDDATHCEYKCTLNLYLH